MGGQSLPDGCSASLRPEPGAHGRIFQEQLLKLFSRLVPLINFAKADQKSEVGAAQFLEELIDACVMECYFRDHMVARDLLFHDMLVTEFDAYNPEAGGARQREFLAHLYRTLNSPGHPIRNRLLRISADSPDLLAVIKQESAV